MRGSTAIHDNEYSPLYYVMLSLPTVPRWRRLAPATGGSVWSGGSGGQRHKGIQGTVRLLLLLQLLLCCCNTATGLQYYCGIPNMSVMKRRDTTVINLNPCNMVNPGRYLPLYTNAIALNRCNMVNAGRYFPPYNIAKAINRCNMVNPGRCLPPYPRACPRKPAPETSFSVSLPMHGTKPC